MQRATAWRLFGVAGAVAASCYVAFGFSIPVAGVLYGGIGAAALIAILVGARRRPFSLRRPWYLFAAGHACFIAGDALWLVYEVAFEGPPPVPSWADILYLVGYPFLGAGLVCLARRRGGGDDRAAAVDSAILATAFGMVAWAFLVEPYLQDASLSLGGRLTAVAYPLADVAFLGAVVRLLVGGGERRTPSLLLLAAGTASLLAADVWYGLASSFGGYRSGGLLDGLWLASYVLWGAAALHPSGDDVTAGLGRTGVTVGRRRVLVLYGAAVLGPIVLAARGIGVGEINLWAMVGGISLMFTLVVVRMTGLVRAIEEQVVELRDKEGVLRSALDERKMLAEQLRHQAFHDPLTGLANRALFLERCAQALASEDGRRTALIFVDVDDFKAVNDGLGHAAGDVLLRTLSERMRSVLREGDLAARFGGDEFAILLTRIGGTEQAAAVAHRLKEALSVPHALESQTVAVHVSLGVALSDGTLSSEELLRRADSAMYAAKHSGKNRVEVFDQGRHAPLIGRGELKTSLARALEQGEFRLDYQPVVDLRTGRVEGAEALIRWNHPERGLVPPLDFIPLAEETDLIIPIGRWVLHEALAHAAEWRHSTPDFTVSVNVSPRQLADPSLPGEVAAALRAHRLPPQALVVEVTERGLADGEESVEVQRAVRALGVRIAIDDFGTGYSSLSYLSKLPIDILKIDRSFTRAMEAGPEERAFAAAVVKLGRTLSLDILAEGIETATARTELRVLGCRWGQGYYFAPPLPADELSALLERRRAGMVEWGRAVIS